MYAARAMRPLPRVGTASVRSFHHSPVARSTAGAEKTGRGLGAARKRIPPELLPMGAAVGLALIGATFALGHHMMKDDLRHLPEHEQRKIKKQREQDG
ncbi:uncharacterized protein L969DRAFT_72775 [Mixia osmundae IAM 14324]|uniref:Uncharacterized protein n=1 Tax=Mixia osmundae (strain CBS 9802 / IAM 14324 / JCM 22182 / KY 12970) TaxID=764103 RepID=G7DUD0_MIXOS|nr:uncharacterized protein L969DRAFT_72775 [Mixia osmundae IAM 14324]KEI41062.1 hypothetical protein L969DRAFT_72775 [Mixia osmundae IAM 14324]GAA94190.1 hypothetical protein E5Q_00838 [Mixia osmundae IAM 14324]